MFTWDPLSGNIVDVIRGNQILNGSAGDWLCVQSPDGRLTACGSAKGTVSVFETHSLRSLHELSGHVRATWALCFTPDSSKVISGSYDTTIRVWDITTGSCLHLLKRDPKKSAITGHSGFIWCVSCRADGKQMVSGSHDGTAIIWDLNTGKMIHVLDHKPSVEKRRRGKDCYVYSIAYGGADGTLIATGSSDHKVRLWNSVSGDLVCELQDQCGHSDSVRSVSFCFDGLMLCSGSSDKTVRVWDVTGRKLVHVLVGHTSSIYFVRYSFL